MLSQDNYPCLQINRVVKGKYSARQAKLFVFGSASSVGSSSSRPSLWRSAAVTLARSPGQRAA